MLFEYMDLYIDSYELNEETGELRLNCFYMKKERTTVIFRGYQEETISSLDSLIGQTIFALEQDNIGENTVYLVMTRGKGVDVAIMAKSVQKVIE